jgi:rSAM/selenodomain-associated transferase 2
MNFVPVHESVVHRKQKRKLWMTVSVIIPALNEACALPATLLSVVKQAEFSEAIVIDGGSSDNTCAIVQQFAGTTQGVRLIHSARGRGAQMNAGARAATGQWLLFLHADTLLPVNAIQLIVAESSRRRAQAGCFHQRFSDPNFRLRFISTIHNLRFQLTGIIYGDQAMFINARLFRELGRFPEQQMEDVLFSETLVRHSRPIMLPASVETDSRKFRQIGELRALAYVLGILANHETGRPVGHRNFFRDYR